MPTAQEPILFVDDEPNVLSGYQRSLHGAYTILAACGGAQALEMLRQNPSVAVVVSDMRMPSMDGVQFIVQARQVCPDATYMMLTGNVDQATAIEAVNQGHIFRFMNKPCPPQAMRTALDAGLRQHQLVTAEKQLLQKTLTGSIKALVDILSLAAPVSFARSQRIHAIVRHLAGDLKGEQRWKLDLAALLSQLGCITVPEAVLTKFFTGKPLAPGEQQMMNSQPLTTARIIGSIPRLDGVAGLIANLAPQRPANEYELDDTAKTYVCLLRAAADYDTLVTQKVTHTSAIKRMRQHGELYGMEILDKLNAYPHQEVQEVQQESNILELNDVYQLRAGMTLADDIYTTEGTMLVGQNNLINVTTLMRIRNFQLTPGLRMPLRVFKNIAEPVADNVIA